MSVKAKSPKSRAPATTNVPRAVAKPSNEDVAIVWGRTEDGSMNILRKRADRIEAGTVQPLREGVPIHGEVIQLRPRQDTPLCDVEVLVPPPKATSDRALALRRASGSTAAIEPSGPAQVATDSYRKNWDSIWRRKPAAKDLN